MGIFIFYKVKVAIKHNLSEKYKLSKVILIDYYNCKNIRFTYYFLKEMKFNNSINFVVLAMIIVSLVGADTIDPKTVISPNQMIVSGTGTARVKADTAAIQIYISVTG